MSASPIYSTNRLNEELERVAVDQLSETFSALADPTRRAILARLAHGEATVNELAEPFPVSLQAVSKHLKVLERAGPDRPREERSVASVPVARRAPRRRHDVAAGLPAVLGVRLRPAR